MLMTRIHWFDLEREKTMYTIRRNYVKVISFLTIISGIIVYLIRFQLCQQAVSVGVVAAAGSNVITLTAILWLFWNSFFWKIPHLLCISGVPNLSGRWKGHYKRNDPSSDGKEHGYVLEIKQTYSSIQCTTYQDNGTSSAGIVSELCTLSDQRTCLVFHWGGTRTSDERSKELRPIYHGLTRVTYSKAVSGKPATLTGDYFTDQGTNGHVNLQFEQRPLLERFTVE